MADDMMDLQSLLEKSSAGSSSQSIPVEPVAILTVGTESGTATLGLYHHVDDWMSALALRAALRCDSGRLLASFS